jgi:hypothetical protein
MPLDWITHQENMGDWNSKSLAQRVSVQNYKATNKRIDNTLDYFERK